MTAFGGAMSFHMQNYRVLTAHTVCRGSMQITHKLYAYLNCKSLVTLLHCLPHTWDEAPGENSGGLSINKYLFNKPLLGKVRSLRDPVCALAELGGQPRRSEAPPETIST